jgi:hypothetical protein
VALLDVSEVVLDPDFSTEFSVVRRSAVTDINGETATTEVTTPGVIGTVYPSEPSSVDRRDDGQMIGHAVTIVTQYRLRGPSAGYQPDRVVLEDGITYTVVGVKPWRFGQGFIEAEALAMVAIAPPPA